MRINSLSPVNNVYSSNPSTVATSDVNLSAQIPVAESNVKASGGSIGGEMESVNIEPMSEELLERSIQQANKNLIYQNRVIERAVHDVTKAIMYTVKDTVTHEVIAEFPPKRIQDMIAKMWELAGLFVDEKA